MDGVGGEGRAQILSLPITERPAEAVGGNDPALGTRYVVDLKLGQFRRLSSPFEVIEFDSEWGKGMSGVEW